MLGVSTQYLEASCAMLVMVGRGAEAPSDHRPPAEPVLALVGGCSLKDVIPARPPEWGAANRCGAEPLPEAPAPAMVSKLETGRRGAAVAA